MIFSANCGPEGAANSFTNFKKEALAIGAQLAAAASASSAAYPAASSAAPATGVATAAYGGVTIAPAPAVSTVTQTVTLASSTWTTTYASYPNSPAATPASLTGNIIKVIVGGNSTLTFDPPHVSAQPRDQIVFEFQTKVRIRCPPLGRACADAVMQNHTVTQSAFADPCRRFTDATTGQLGFDSGFFPVANGTTDFPTFTLTVNDTAPIWAVSLLFSPLPLISEADLFFVPSTAARRPPRLTAAPAWSSRSTATRPRSARSLRSRTSRSSSTAPLPPS